MPALQKQGDAVSGSSSPDKNDETPRTNAHMRHLNLPDGNKIGLPVHSVEFMRQLERELNSARQLIRECIVEGSTPSHVRRAACDCKSYNGGPCFNCINGAHQICDNGQRVCPASVAPSATALIEPPSEGEIAAYRDLFRSELDKNMNNSSDSPSTEAHAVALRRFIEVRNRCRGKDATASEIFAAAGIKATDGKANK